MRRSITFLATLLLAACSQPADKPARVAETTDPAAAATAIGSEPCPALSAQAAEASAPRFASSVSLDGVSFSRERGSSACRIDEGGDVACDMRSPGLVKVGGAAAGAQVFYFDVPAGRDARVSMSHDIARCTLQ